MNQHHQNPRPQERGQRRDPAPYSASGVQLKHAVWKADEPPGSTPGGWGWCHEAMDGIVGTIQVGQLDRHHHQQSLGSVDHL